MNTECGPSREMKHIRFYGRIERLENSIEKLKYLTDKVEGVGKEPSGMNKAEVAPTPSLTGCSVAKATEHLTLKI